MLVAQNSLGSVCPVPLTVRGSRGGGGGLMGPPGDRVTFEQMEEHESEKGTRRKHFRQSVPKTN